MTPTEALAATPEQLAPVVAEIMGDGWVCVRDRILFHEGQTYGRRIIPCDRLDDAHLLRDEIADLELCSEVIEALRAILPGAKPMMENEMEWLILTASPLDITRACVAAYLASKEPA